MNMLKGFVVRLILYAAALIIWDSQGYNRLGLALIFLTIFFGVRLAFKEFPFHNIGRKA